jgi:hypothetical protein
MRCFACPLFFLERESGVETMTKHSTCRTLVVLAQNGEQVSSQVVDFMILKPIVASYKASAVNKCCSKEEESAALPLGFDMLVC